MKTGALIFPIVLAALAGTASAQTSRLAPVESTELNRYVGSNLKGRAFADLGIVEQVDRRSGLIGLRGRYSGDFTVIHNSLLYRNGARLRAPSLSYADVSNGSGFATRGRTRALVAPHITVEEFDFQPENSR
jgi:hypothetical protein